MKRLRKIIFSLIAIAIVFPLTALSANAPKPQTPDFNYPKTVIANAENQLDMALKSGNGNKVIQALIKSSLAKSMISQDNFADIIQNIDTVIVKESNPCTKALLYYLEAYIYNDYYNSQYHINSRSNIVGTSASDVTAWNADQFKTKISHLLQSALQDSQALQKAPITQYSEIISIQDNSISTYPTLYDFLAYKCLNLYENLSVQSPFNPYVRKSENKTSLYRNQIEGIYQNLLQFHNDGTEAYINAMLLKCDDLKNHARLDSLYLKYQDNPNCALILLAKIDNNDTAQNSLASNYQLLEQYLTKFPASTYSALIYNRLAIYKRKDVEIKYDRTYSSKDSIAIECDVTNVNRFKIYVYRAQSNNKDNGMYIGANSIFGKNNDVKPVYTQEINRTKQIPFSDTVKVNLPPLPYGRYVALVHYDEGNTKSLQQATKDQKLSTFSVSDLTLFTVQQNAKHATELIIVNSITGQPVEGASISLFHKNKENTPLGITNKKGILTVSKLGYETCCFSLGKDHNQQAIYGYNFANSTKVHNDISIFTDLAVYRPGETAHFSAICYQRDLTQKRIRPNQKCNVVFSDANNDSISAVELITDAQGRIYHDFVVPNDRMNGTFNIRVSTTIDDREWGTSKTINVSEYKTPTFYIEWTDAQKGYKSTGKITLKGNAKSFTEMPKANMNIIFDISQSSWFSDFQPLFNEETVTDSIGNFSLTINAKELRANNSTYDLYRVTARGTDTAGDTQSAQTIFTLGPSIQLIWGEQHTFDASSPIKLPLTVKSYEGNNSETLQCRFTMRNTKKEIVKEGIFLSNDPTVNLADLASGEYSVDFQATNDTLVKLDSTRIVIYRPTDKQPPLETALWIPIDAKATKPGCKDSFTIGSSFDNTPVYYVINSGNNIIKEGWINVNKGLSKFDYLMPSEQFANLKIQFYNITSGHVTNPTVTISPARTERVLALEVESFRDKITAKSQEKWTIHLSLDGKPFSGGAIMCEMFDKSINQIQDNTWAFKPELLRLYAVSHLNALDFGFQSGSYSLSWSPKTRKYQDIVEPSLILYNQSFFASRVRRIGRGMRVQNLAANESLICATDEAAVSGNFEETKKMMAPSFKTIEPSVNDYPLRSSAIKTAFWHPNLTTDDNGNASLEFTVPDFNTTWIFQVLGYSSDLVTASFLKNVISTKPIMVKPNLPRFLRQGDKASLLANVENSTDSIQMCNVTIELFNPTNNAIVTKQDTAVTLLPKASKGIAINYETPDTVSMLGYRIYASNGNFRDGEQNIIPVLQSISPIIETKPFFIDANRTDYTLDIPVSPQEGRVTLEYCDNPTWYVVTALPTIFNNGNITATAITHSLFAIKIADKIAQSHPEIKTAINYWHSNSQDSALISMLAKNANLKIGTLLASPWLKESEQQSLRMSQIAELFDKNNITKQTTELIGKLQSLQLADGGWAWYRYPQCKSSEWTTLEVLQLLGEMKQLNALPDDATLSTMLNDAIKYLDKNVIDRHNQRKNKLDYSGFGDYAYTRSLYSDFPMSITVKGLYDKIIQSLSTEWKALNMAEKAYAAVTLANNSKNTTAKQILESLRQFSITKPGTGMYWDNLQNGGYRYYDKTALTSLLLKTFNKIEPTSPDIDQIRKWMLLEKQTNDWGSSSLAADAVCSLLSTGTKWIGNSNNTEILLNGKPIAFDRIDKILGYCQKSITANTDNPHSTLSIRRTGASPSWGAVYCQYSAPMSAIKAASVPELSITKEIISSNQGKGNPQIGDKVQIRMVIRNTKDLQFATLSDERAACFEPVDKLSGYQYSDGIGYYLEVKDDKTNIFINNLPKGTHIITYDAYVTNNGIFNSGIATIQCQYAPQITAHSDGNIVTIK